MTITTVAHRVFLAATCGNNDGNNKSRVLIGLARGLLAGARGTAGQQFKLS